MTRIKELIGLMGRKRFIILIIALALTGAMGYAWQYYLVPQNETLTREKSSVESALNSLRAEIEGLPAKYADLAEKEARYTMLQEKGFTQDQDRISARERLDRLRVESGLRGIQYNINPQTVVSHPEDYMMAHNIVQSEINVGLKGLTDLEMREFINKMTSQFSGLVVFRAAEFKRESPVTPENLARLSNKMPVDFVTGTASFTWYSLVEKSATDATLQQQAFGGISQ